MEDNYRVTHPYEKILSTPLVKRVHSSGSGSLYHGNDLTNHYIFTVSVKPAFTDLNLHCI